MNRAKLLKALLFTVLVMVLVCLLALAIGVIIRKPISQPTPIPLLEFPRDTKLNVGMHEITWTPGGLMARGLGVSNGSIYIANFDTAELQSVYIDDQLVSGHLPSLSPSGELILFYDRDLRRIRVIQRSPPYHEVLRLPIEGHPTWSPQGDRLAVIGKSSNTISIRIFNLEGIELSEAFTMSDQTWRYPYEIAWSPDGKKLAFSLTNKPTIEHDDQIDIFVLWLEDGRVSQITHTPTIRESSPSWSPDSNLLVFTSTPLGKGWESKIAFANIVRNCERVVPLVEGILGTAWSPDGNQIAIVTLSGSIQIFDLKALDPAFTSPTQICP